MPVADCVLLLANVLYATSYVATRLTLAHVPPAMLALFRLLIAAVILLPLAWWRPRVALTAREHVSVAAMGVIGFAAAFVLANEGLARSTVTNAALLIAIEPLTVMLLGPLLLGEHLTSREKAGAALAVLGAVLVVVNGVPGVTAAVVPHWRGDLLLLCSGVAYAAYTLIGRPVLSQRPALPVTAYSIGWGIPALVPVVAAEWLAGTRPMPDGVAVAGTLYLGAVVTAGGYLVWNWALERVPAPRAAVFLNIQPVAGAMLGVLVFGEPLTVFTITGGLFVVAGLGLAVRACATPGAVRAVRRRAPAARPARGTRCRE